MINNFRSFLCEVMSMSFDDKLKNVSGGMANPASVYTEEEFLTPGSPNRAKWWFESNSEGARACNREEAISFSKKYDCDENEILEIWERYHKD